MYAPSLPDRSLDQYADLVPAKQLDKLHTLADDYADRRVLHVNSTASGGGVAELLRSLVPLFRDLGVETDWMVIDADDPFFEVTKTLHNGLQGQEVTITDEMRSTYQTVIDRNDGGIDSEYDVIVLHDPQPLGLVEPLTQRFPDVPIVWRCHIDLTNASPDPLEFVTQFARQTDHAVFSCPEYGHQIDGVPNSAICPSIDPLTDKNRPLSDAETASERERLADQSIPVDAPLVTQVSRFDPWKDQFGTVEAFRTARDSSTDAHLVLVGGMADDDPEGEAIFEKVADEVSDDPSIHLLTNEPDTTINYLQRRSEVIAQKSLREGFGLVVSEALWKRTPVVGSNAGGIPKQIQDGENGYLVGTEDVGALSDRIERLLGDEKLRRRLGDRGRETIRELFLPPRHLSDHLTLFNEIQGA